MSDDADPRSAGFLVGDGDRTVALLALFALAQVVVAATLPAGDLLLTAALETLLVGLLLVPLTTGPAPGRTVAAFLVALAGLGGLAWGTFAIAESLWLVAVVLGVVVAPVAYYLHRYARVVAGRHGDLPPSW